MQRNLCDFQIVSACDALLQSLAPEAQKLVGTSMCTDEGLDPINQCSNAPIIARLPIRMQHPPQFEWQDPLAVHKRSECIANPLRITKVLKKGQQIIISLGKLK